MSHEALLCVDDELAILRILKRQFNRLFGSQYIYEVAQSVDEAWDIITEFEDEDVELVMIISDWMMPNVRGDEFLAQVHLKFPDVITVMLTGQADEDAIDRAKKTANLFACIQKPWKEKDLETIMRSALEN